MTQPYIINDNWAIIGSTAWYDYSYAHERFSEEQLQSGKHYGATWQDKVRIDWTVDDRQLSKQFADELRAHASQVAPRKTYYSNAYCDSPCIYGSDTTSSI